ncbi:Prolyl tripeptidyl peptidase precursor [Streptomyces sp. YIM 130001]|uniref:S9 family peptidase n=1 Tax=Streptomyces sp. YIM 130001 TaxID=2259644 RepID=UPI000EDBD3A4|nr:S9 family peptidase [Streptomyces sp. YIM 130001]RII14822.1 Prolyl tripeptidyl peptidase precursor [Streptomyces sp. YIM 130001]
MAESSERTTQYERVLRHLRSVHEPGFGLPSGGLRELHVTRDGARTVVTADVLDDLDGLPRTALCTAQDSRLRQVSASGGSARSGRFSPDGRTLAFLSDRAGPGVFQLHLLVDEQLGEAEPAPAVPGTIEYLHWSPDGTRILLGVAGLGAELSGGQGSGSNRREGGDEAPSWAPRVDGETAGEAWRSLWVYTPGTGVLDRLTPEGLNCWEAGWCGPERVAAITSDAPGEDDWYGADLSLVEPDGSVRKVLGSEVQLGLPVGSPDGRWLAVAEAVCSDRWVLAGDLLLVDPGSGAVRRLDTRGTDVTRLEWIDGERLGYLGQRHLNSVAGTVRVADGEVTEVLSTARACGGSTFHPDGAFTADGRVCTIQESYRLPQQLVLSGPDGDRVLGSVTHPGTDYLRSVAGTAEPVAWHAPDGTEIEGILCTPDGEGPFPLVVNIHGGPVWAFRETWSMRSQWVPLLVSRGYAVLNPNPRGSSGRGQAFAGLVVGDMGGADTQDYLSGIDALVERGVVDGDRVGLIGASYGGFMSSWLVTQDRRFAASVPVSPVTNWYSQGFTSNIAAWGNRFLDADPEQHGTRAHTRSPVLHASKARTPCLNVAGALDNCTPPGQAQEFHQALRAHGVPSALVIYPQEGHGVRAYPAQIDFLARVMDWFEQYMPAAPESAT